ncbi:hypothetical protein ACOSQ4_015411 [Xanthoceras sorbifolium]
MILEVDIYFANRKYILEHIPGMNNSDLDTWLRSNLSNSKPFPNYVQNGINDSISLFSWTPPSLGWLKINVDGSVVNGLISAGGVIRDHDRKWVRGFAMNIGYGSVLEAEVWGIFEGFKMASLTVKKSVNGTKIIHF